MIAIEPPIHKLDFYLDKLIVNNHKEYSTMKLLGDFQSGSYARNLVQYQVVILKYMYYTDIYHV